MLEVFDRHGITYRIGGSVASSAYGVARSTLDVDLSAEISPEHVAVLAAELANDCYVDEEMIRKAVDESSSFILIHNATMVKIDVFLPKASEYDQVAFGRCRAEVLDPAVPPGNSIRPRIVEYLAPYHDL